MRHIPLALLGDQCTLKTFKRTGIFGDRQLLKETVLSRVCCDVKDRLRTGTLGEAFHGAGKVYFDCGRSSPEDAEFMAEGCESSVVFMGREYRVVGVRYIYSAGRLHHAEIMLGGVS